MSGGSYGTEDDCGLLVACLDVCNAAEGGADPACTRACYNDASQSAAVLRFSGEYCIFGECLSGGSLDFLCLIQVAQPGGACYELSSQCTAPAE